jgi:hypothetical protein
MSVLVAACYGSRDSNEQSDEMTPAPDSGAAGRAAPRDGSSGGPPRDGGTGGVSGDAGQCGAFRTPENDGIYIDQDAFSGIGGAGAMLAGTCKRCGWDSRGEMCQTLVASVPTIGNSNYYPCLSFSIEFTSCLEVESCVCGGEVPKRCAAIKAKQDACLQSVYPFGADGGGDTATDWMDVQTACKFGFKAPLDYQNEPVQGTDSCVLAFSAAGCQFGADYGWYSGGVRASPGDLNYREEAAQIDGRAATVVAYTTIDPTEYVAAIHFPMISQVAPATKLTIFATCPSASAQSDALTLFSTIHFD